jgi:4-hydroxybenzoate polyprenyltransferase
MKAWPALLKTWATLLPAHRWALCLGLFLGVCLMTFYMQVLNEHMVRADQVRLGQRTAPNTLAETTSTRR